MIEIIVMIAGIIMGWCLTIIYYSLTSVHGTVRVDHKNGLCGIQMEYKELSNTHIKRAILNVDHGATIDIDSKDEEK